MLLKLAGAPDRERLRRGSRRHLNGVRHTETVQWQFHQGKTVLDCFGNFWRCLSLDGSGQLWTAALRKQFQLVLAGYGRSWAGSARLWAALVRSGRLWEALSSVLKCSGHVWETLEGLWVSPGEVWTALDGALEEILERIWTVLNGAGPFGIAWKALDGSL